MLFIKNVSFKNKLKYQRFILYFLTPFSSIKSKIEKQINKNNFKMHILIIIPTFPSLISFSK